jgi:hypothetical protein
VVLARAPNPSQELPLQIVVAAEALGSRRFAKVPSRSSKSAAIVMAAAKSLEILACKPSDF